jgi:hypothetical protein
MKKIPVLFLFLLSFGCMQAQLLNSFGINGGVTFAKHKWTVKEDANTPLPPYANDAQKWKTSWNAALFLEMFQNEHWRWVSEAQYNHKGSIDVNNPEKGKKLATTTTDLAWNNYLKFRYEIYYGVPYIFAGPRAEYVLSQSTASPEIARGSFHKIQISPAVGIGWEFITFGMIKPFIEGIYNPDLAFGPTAYHTLDLSLWNRAIEARVGLRFELTPAETCPRVYK